MDNNEIEQLFTLIGERFYEHIEVQYGKLIEKILRYHDIDSYIILSQVGTHELIDLFEKPNDEDSTSELINLKKEICNISHDSISLKIGTKNKMILLLKSAQNIVKKKRVQLVSQARLNRLDQHRSSSSSSANNSTSDSETSIGKYHASIEESVTQLLTQLKHNIHDIIYTNVSMNDFKIIIEKPNDSIVPVCSIQCICGDRIKLYLKNYRFQLTNFTKHLKKINNKVPFFINNKNQELNDPEVSDQMDTNDQLLRSESNRSINDNNSSKYIHANADANDKSTLSQRQKSQREPDNNEYSGSSAKTTNNLYNGQPPTRIFPAEGETESSISIISSSKPKKQLVNNQQRQITKLPPNYQHFKSLKEPSLNQNNSSQSKKRKFGENEKRIESHSSTKNNKKISELNVSKVEF
ncbi:unnamed protein product [Rotaria magnacalcarata]|uniref:Uncharacterized protein n=1 Tax=Rotaria magnacalcarata TaxID=392030 RepID=A0A815L8J0_9BILA|nr:unnamed protein product [Rotaria magnacalcarata]CAF4504451.1 unnamed protein product [Rotaria magnacalcarata]